jgi:hypothetical protein
LIARKQLRKKTDQKIFDAKKKIGYKYRLDYFEPLAQSVEHLTFNQVVVGSIPTRLTTKTRGQAFDAWPFFLPPSLRP